MLLAKQEVSELMMTVQYCTVLSLSFSVGVDVRWTACLQDPAEKPSSASSVPVEGENGARRCPERGCRNVNWAYRASCGRLRPGWGFRVTWLCTVQCGIISAVHFCATKADRSRSRPPVEGDRGNWRCLHCRNVNYPQRLQCYLCQKPKPP